MKSSIATCVYLALVFHQAEIISADEPADQTQEAISAFENLLQQRRKITSGKVTVTVRYKFHMPSETSAMFNQTTSTFKFAFDDVHSRFSGLHCEERPENSRQIPCRKFSRVKNHYRVIPGDKENLVAYEFRCDDVATLPPKNHDTRNGVATDLDISLQGLGFYPNSFQSHKMLDNMVLLDRLKSLVSRTRSASFETSKVADQQLDIYLYSIQPDLTYIVKSDPNQDGMPASVEFVTGEPGSPQYHSVLESTWEQYITTEGTFWFPQRVHFTQSFNRKIQHEETWDVDVTSINHPLPENLFGWEGLGLRDGAPVDLWECTTTEKPRSLAYKAAERTFVDWVPKPAHTQTQTQPATPRNTGLLLAIIMLTVSALLFLGLAFWWKKKSG